MFKIPSYDKTNRASMDAADAQISTARTKNRAAFLLSGAVLAGGAFAVINGVFNAEYANEVAKVAAVVPEVACSIVGGSGVLAHLVQGIRLRNASSDLNFDIAVDDAIIERGYRTRR